MSEKRQFLILDDEPMIAMLLGDYLEVLGHEVTASVDTIEDAFAAIDRGGIDCAILDARLADDAMSWPVADRLADAEIPFILSSGDATYEVPERFLGCLTLPKPYTIDALDSVISML